MQEQDYITFEAYLTGDLKPEEQLAFEKRLNTDADVKLAFESYKNASKFLKHHIENDEKNQAFKTNLESVSNTYFQNKAVAKNKVKRINPWYYSVAAAAILLIGFFIGQQFSNPVYDDFANYESISLTVRGSQQDVLTKAETAFNNKNYQNANKYFSELLKTDASNLELKLYNAVALVELDRFDEADAVFENIIASPSVYRNKATWYLALSKLKQEDNVACLKILQTLPKDADDYKQAQKLIKKLD
ncbi:tetratricopeptide repeat protein [Corallibacter sp.]|uniref:tetratricopeptide repeat protein n=1 Tax=Corallibacter sp. TaxID=2038084 RepID=UPI003AB23F71